MAASSRLHLSAFLLVILNRFGKGVGSQIGAVQLFFWKSIEGLCNGLICYQFGLFYRFSLCHFTDHAGYGNGRNTSESLVFHINKSITFDLDVESHHVTTYRVADFSDTVSIYYFTEIPRIREMVHYLF